MSEAGRGLRIALPSFAEHRDLAERWMAQGALRPPRLGLRQHWARFWLIRGHARAMRVDRVILGCNPTLLALRLWRSARESERALGVFWEGSDVWDYPLWELGAHEDALRQAGIELEAHRLLPTSAWAQIRAAGCALLMDRAPRWGRDSGAALELGPWEPGAALGARALGAQVAKLRLESAQAGVVRHEERAEVYIWASRASWVSAALDGAAQAGAQAGGGAWSGGPSEPERFGSALWREADPIAFARRSRQDALDCLGAVNHG